MTMTTTETDDLEIPGCNLDDPAEVEAFFGNFGMAEHFRKSVQASCEELVRADYARREEKITETRISALARVHQNYMAFLVETLQGRVARERNVLASLRNGA